MHHNTIISTLLTTIDSISDHDITGITLGGHITGVESRNMGLATWAWEGIHPLPRDQFPFYDPQWSARQTAQLLRDTNSLAASLGLAALNSLLPAPCDTQFESINAKELVLSLGEGKTVAVLGHFPFVAQLKKKFKNLMVFEKKPKPGDISADLIPDLLPEADLVALTATTLSNHSLGDVLSFCSPRAIKIMVGPSTPLTPALFDLGFDYLAGTLVQERAVVKNGITRDLPFKQLKGVTHVIIGREGSALRD